MTGPRLLGVFAHPDDEVFCAGGTFAKYASEGAEVMVLSATRGQAGQIRDATAATRRTLGAVREQELRRSCDRLGASHVVLLDHMDGTLAGVDREGLIAEVVDVVRDFRPDTIISFGEDGAYGHPDHVTMSETATAAFHRAASNAHRSARPPHRTASLYHSHFPHSRLLLLDHLAGWLTELKDRFKGTSDFVQALSLFARETTTMRYASDFVDVEWFPPGCYIVEQGEMSTSLYLILSGVAEVRQESADGAVELIRTLGPGEFFGELGVVGAHARTAHVVAGESVTCLVLSPRPATAFEGRGDDAVLVSSMGEGFAGEALAHGATTRIDVRDHVPAKVGAIAAYRTQYPIRADMFPPGMLEDMFGLEYFVRVEPPMEPESALLVGGGRSAGS